MKQLDYKEINWKTDLAKNYCSQDKKEMPISVYRGRSHKLLQRSPRKQQKHTKAAYKSHDNETSQKACKISQ